MAARKLVLLAVLGLVAVGGVAASTLLRPPPEATGPIQAVALEQAPSSSAVDLFEIQPDQSRARFIIDEILRGSPKTVVGETGQVAGQVAVDLTDPDTARIGTIRINARTFATDSTQRDRMIQNQILQTEPHEYIVFTPTRLEGMPETASLGQVMTFHVIGDLTIRGVTREVTFDTTVTPESADRLQGRASATIRYADWGISIPQVPAVAGVSETVRLELDFIATTPNAASTDRPWAPA